MESIHQKAQQEQARGFCQEIIDKLEGLPADTPDWKAALHNVIDEIIQAGQYGSQPPVLKSTWDFSKEKSQIPFVRDDLVTIRPVVPADEDFYRGIRMQYSHIYRSAYYAAKDKKDSLFLSEALIPEVFYCIIENSQNGQPIGYLGIKDTSADMWEIAIELDGESTKYGYGPRSIRLYLNEIQRITSHSVFRALVEVDNIPSQKCFDKLGAKLVGLHDSVVLKTKAERERFEEKNLSLIDAHMIGLAERIGVAPRELLSHVLDYRIMCPLND